MLARDMQRRAGIKRHILSKSDYKLTQTKLITGALVWAGLKLRKV